MLFSGALVFQFDKMGGFLHKIVFSLLGMQALYHIKTVNNTW